MQGPKAPDRSLGVAWCSFVGPRVDYTPSDKSFQGVGGVGGEDMGGLRRTRKIDVMAKEKPM